MGTPEQDLEQHLREEEKADAFEDEVARRLWAGNDAWEALYHATTRDDYEAARAALEEVLDHVGELFYPEH